MHLAAAGPSALQTSSNWSGIAVTSGATFTSVSATWKVPTVKVTPGNRYAADWVGIGGYSTGSEDLIQAGTQGQIVGGSISYYAWTEVLPEPESQITGLAIHPGDTMSVSLTGPSPSWTIVVRDSTTGKSKTVDVNYVSSGTSAEWIHEAPTVGGSQSRLATTSNVVFTNGLANGGVIGAAGNTVHRIQLVGPTDATPSTLDATKNGFTVADGSKAPEPPS
jgi:hypothetical protein